MVSKLTLEYDGAEFAGWARQPGQRSVQEEVERALSTFLREPVALTVAGRTDRGVHAWGQVASYRHEAVDPQRLNAVLPADVAVLACEPRGEGFDARGDALEPDVLLPAAATAQPQRVRAWTRAVVVATAAARGVARLRGDADAGRTTSPPSRRPRPSTCASNATC